MQPAASASEISPLSAGDPVPEVALADIRGDTVKLRENCRERPLILIFYRGGWCPYCNAQLAKLGGIEDSLRSLGYKVFAVSPDLPAFLRESKEKHGLARGTRTISYPCRRYSWSTKSA